MTAVINTNTNAEAEVDALSGSVTTLELEDFLRDPIGYGDFDFANPITLDEFATVVHFHDRYVAPLT